MNRDQYKSFFRGMSEVVTLYVGLLALVGLLASVGFFRLRVEPTLKMLNPVYVFDMPQLIRAFESYSPGHQFHKNGELYQTNSRYSLKRLAITLMAQNLLRQRRCPFNS